MQQFWFIPSLCCELVGAFARLCPVVYTFVYVSSALMQQFCFIPSLRCEWDGAFARLCPVVYTFVYVSGTVSADQLLVP